MTLIRRHAYNINDNDKQWHSSKVNFFFHKAKRRIKLSNPAQICVIITESLYAV